MGCAGLLVLRPAGGVAERNCAVAWVAFSWGQVALMQHAPERWLRWRGLLLVATHVLRAWICQPPLLQAGPGASAACSLRCAGSAACQARSCSSAALLATNMLNALLYVALHQQPVLQHVPVLLLCLWLSLARFTSQALELLRGTGCESPLAALRQFADRAMLVMLSGPAPGLQHLTPEHLQPGEGEDVLLVRFVTNTTKETTTGLLAQLHQAGFDVEERQVFSSLRAAKRLIRTRGLRPLLLLHPDALPEFEGVDTTDPDAVVLGLAKEAFTYTALNEAFRYYKDSDGELSLGPGPFAAALEYATGRQAEVVGKPEGSFFQLALDDCGVGPAEAVMVGDDVRDDVGGAQAAGMRGLLVRTGKYLEGDEVRYGIQPTATVADFEAAVDWILQRQGNLS